MSPNFEWRTHLHAWWTNVLVSYNSIILSLFWRILLIWDLPEMNIATSLCKLIISLSNVLMTSRFSPNIRSFFFAGFEVISWALALLVPVSSHSVTAWYCSVSWIVLTPCINVHACMHMHMANWDMMNQPAPASDAEFLEVPSYMRGVHTCL